MSELATPTERIMADADAMLAALKRDLEIAARSAASEGAAPPEPLVARVIDAPPPDAPQAAPEPLPPAVVNDSADDVARDVKLWVDPTMEPELEEEGEEREERPRRGRLIGVAALVLALVAAPAILWVQRNPDTVRAWSERLSAIANGAVDTPAQVESVAAPQAPAATTSTQQPIAPVGGVTTEAMLPAASEPPPPASTEVSDPAKAEASDAPPAAAPVEQARSRSTKARSGSRSTSRSSRSASRERTRQ
jgi:hypothetical protein